MFRIGFVNESYLEFTETVSPVSAPRSPRLVEGKAELFAQTLNQTINVFIGMGRTRRTASKNLYIR